MMARRQRFSRRHGVAPEPRGPLIYDDAPKELRIAFLGFLEDDLDYSPSSMRSVVCRELRIEPRGDNWSEYPNIWDEVQGLVYRCEWYKFFDIVEAFTPKRRRPGEPDYEEEVNDLFGQERIGWMLVDGELELRGDEPLEKVLENAFQELEVTGLEVATNELSEAWADLSRRPAPDLSGSVQHCMAALEAIARQWSDDSKKTLGELIKKHPEMFPAPLNEAVSKLWGYASNEARHGKEKRNLDLDEAFLVVGASATLATYLARKIEEAE